MQDQVEQLRRIIHQWNENRYDLFQLSDPNDELEFHGVMRFYFQESGARVATKCVRVSSTATTRAVIEALVDKFHPDLKMLTMPEYTLWEVHENGEERMLQENEKPLLVQLNWHKDDREGRFLLRRKNEPMPTLSDLKSTDEAKMKRKLSKRQKKELKEKEKLARASDIRCTVEGFRAKEAEDVAEKLYKEMPETGFTRTISNPEIVMKKRRERKLEQKLREMEDAAQGGSLKIHGEALSESRPYVTLLLSTKDTALRVVKETLEKYGMDKEDPNIFCLVQIIASMSDSNDNIVDTVHPQERILADDECPLEILSRLQNTKGAVTFHIRRRPSVYETQHLDQMNTSLSRPPDHFSKDSDALRREGPYLEELNSDGTDVIGRPPQALRILPEITEIGSDPALGRDQPGVFMPGPHIHPRHCIFTFSDGIVTITPANTSAEIRINGQQVSETTILRHGYVLRLGRSHVFRYFAPPDSVEHEGQHGLPSPEAKRAQNLPPPGRIRGRHGPAKPSRAFERPSYFVENFGYVSTGSASPALTDSTTVMETTFDVTGDIRTVTNQIPSTPMSIATLPSTFARGRERKRNRSADSRASKSSGTPMMPMGSGRDTIPAVIELLVPTEEAFLKALIRDIEANSVMFKLAPVYVLYMVSRYRISPHFKTGLHPQERGRHLAAFLQRATDMMHVTVQDHCHDASSLAFWLANTSELLNFLKQDLQLSAFTEPEPQESLADAVQKAYGHVAACLRQDLHQALPPMLEPSLDDPGATSPCLHVMSGAMSLLRHCRVNAALTIQLFSQLFHTINMFIFNRLVSPDGRSFCCNAWGERLSNRLNIIQTWSEKQGLELAAECHLAKVAQAAHLLHMRKRCEDLPAISSTCYRLNSTQIRYLLEKYSLESGEYPISREFIEGATQIAENAADEHLRSDGRPITLEEDVELNLPFLLPEDGYSCDVVKGIPPQLQEFLAALMTKGFCRVVPQPNSSGSWTVHMDGASIRGSELELCPPRLQQQQLQGQHVMTGSEQELMEPRVDKEPEIVTVAFSRGTGGIGLSIVAAEEIEGGNLAIYVKKVVPGSVADQDGRLQPADKLLAVNGHSLQGITQEQAAEIMSKCGPNVSFTVAKQAAHYNGVALYLTDGTPSPSVQQTHPMFPHGPPPQRFRSEEHLGQQHLPSRSGPHQRMNGAPPGGGIQVLPPQAHPLHHKSSSAISESTGRTEALPLHPPPQNMNGSYRPVMNGSLRATIPPPRFMPPSIKTSTYDAGYQHSRTGSGGRIGAPTTQPLSHVAQAGASPSGSLTRDGMSLGYYHPSTLPGAITQSIQPQQQPARQSPQPAPGTINTSLNSEVQYQNLHGYQQQHPPLDMASMNRQQLDHADIRQVPFNAPPTVSMKRLEQSNVSQGAVPHILPHSTAIAPSSQHGNYSPIWTNSPSTITHQSMESHLLPQSTSTATRIPPGYSPIWVGPQRSTGPGLPPRAHPQGTVQTVVPAPPIPATRSPQSRQGPTTYSGDRMPHVVTTSPYRVVAPHRQPPSLQRSTPSPLPNNTFPANSEPTHLVRAPVVPPPPMEDRGAPPSYNSHVMHSAALTNGHHQNFMHPFCGDSRPGRDPRAFQFPPGPESDFHHLTPSNGPTPSPSTPLVLQQQHHQQTCPPNYDARYLRQNGSMVNRDLRLMNQPGPAATNRHSTYHPSPVHPEALSGIQNGHSPTSKRHSLEASILNPPLSPSVPNGSPFHPNVPPPTTSLVNGHHGVNGFAQDTRPHEFHVNGGSVVHENQFGLGADVAQPSAWDRREKVPYNFANRMGPEQHEPGLDNDDNPDDVDDESWKQKAQEEVSRWRDAEIEELENRSRELLNTDEERRLNYLKLEREFQRRALEDDDEEGPSTPTATSEEREAARAAYFENAERVLLDSAIKARQEQETVTRDLTSDRFLEKPQVSTSSPVVGAVDSHFQQMNLSEPMPDRVVESSNVPGRKAVQFDQAPPQIHYRSVSEISSGERSSAGGPPPAPPILPTSPPPLETMCLVEQDHRAISENGFVQGNGHVPNHGFDPPITSTAPSALQPQAPPMKAPPPPPPEKPPKYTVTNTTAVIGAQEVYRDPREQRLRAAQQSAFPPSSVEGEKLSFKEKMKLFAKEAGENNTPTSRLKVSSAQREIEATILQP